MKAIRLLLLPFTIFYYIFITIKNLLYKAGIFISESSPIPAVCVGNLSAGGTGKTPIIITLANHLQKSGLKIAILSRGYRRNSTGFFEVLDGNIQKYGDEPVMIKRNVSDSKVFVCEDRVEGVKEIAKIKNYDYILLDDGFQNRKLKKDYSFIVIDKSDNTIQNRLLLPAGNLRETKSSLKLADAILSNYKFSNVKAANEKNVFNVNYELDGYYDYLNNRKEKAEIINYKFLAFCGIGKSNSFIELLYNEKLNIAEKKNFSDHHNYTVNDIESLKGLLKSSNSDYFITTEKDFVRLEFLLKDKEFLKKVLFLKISAKIHDIDEMILQMRNKIKREVEI